MSRLSWLTSLPASAGGALMTLPDVINGLRVLPELLDRLDRVAEATDSLPELNESLKIVREHTAALPEVRDEVTKVTAATVSMAPMLEQLTDQLVHFEGTLERVVLALEPLGATAERLRLPGRKRRNSTTEE